MKHEGNAGWVWRGAAWITAAGLLAALAAQPRAAFGGARTAGATVVVTTGGGAVKGELIGVREDGIVLMSEKGDNTILISEIDNVRIVRHAPILGLGLLGLAVGGAVGFLAAPHIQNEDPLGEGLVKLVKDFAYTSIGCIIGIGAGVGTALAIGKDKVIIFKGRTKEENTTALNGLRKEARVSDYR
jgi:hypothetical protein